MQNNQQLQAQAQAQAQSQQHQHQPQMVAALMQTQSVQPTMATLHSAPPPEAAPPLQAKPQMPPQQSAPVQPPQPPPQVQVQQPASMSSSGDPEVVENIQDQNSSEEEKAMPEFNRGDVVVVGDKTGVLRYYGPLFTDPMDMEAKTDEYYIGIECCSELETDGKGHTGWFEEFQYFHT